MTLAAQITNIKEVERGTPISYNRRWAAKRRTHIATVGIGYADGYPRSLLGKAEVGIAGRRHPVVGTICMDMIMVDLGPEPPAVSVGDHVVLFGRGGPDVSDVADWADTISYEIICGLGKRVERQFS
ncbi:MAG: alanine racemase C-terminal domain-containing protein, partial [Candidatus Latescibacterota bacterium]|jgi:alanine racemase